MSGISFSLGKKPENGENSSKKNVPNAFGIEKKVEEKEVRVEVSEISGGKKLKTLQAEKGESSPTIVIPCIGNTYQTGLSARTNGEERERDTEGEREREREGEKGGEGEREVDTGESKLGYGLVKLEKKKRKSEEDAMEVEEEGEREREKERERELTAEELEEMARKRVLEQALSGGANFMDDEDEDESANEKIGANAASNEVDYDRVPVDKFGMAMLMGMGYSEKRGIGKTTASQAKPIEFIARHHRLGLGAEVPKEQLEAMEKAKQRRKKYMGEKKDSKYDYALFNEQGGRRTYRHVDEQLEKIPLHGWNEGARVRIVGGKHFDPSAVDRDGYAKTLTAKIISINKEDNTAVVKLDINKEETLVKRRHVHIMMANGKYEGAVPKATRRESSSASSSSKRRKTTPSIWLRPHLRVRVVSQSLKDGRWYNKKGEILDVVAGDMCTLRMDETNALVEGVKQRHLETLIPKSVPSIVMIVGGRNSGCVGRLLRKDRKKQSGDVHITGEGERERGGGRERESGKVGEIVTASFDDMCEVAEAHFGGDMDHDLGEIHL